MNGKLFVCEACQEAKKGPAWYTNAFDVPVFGLTEDSPICPNCGMQMDPGQVEGRRKVKYRPKH